LLFRATGAKKKIEAVYMSPAKWFSGKKNKIGWGLLLTLAAISLLSFFLPKGNRLLQKDQTFYGNSSLTTSNQEVNTPNSGPLSLAEDGIPVASDRSHPLASAPFFDPATTPVISRDTRIYIEQLASLYRPEEVQEELRRLSVILPTPAYYELVRLLDSYKRYEAAVKEAYPPDKEVSTVEEALAQLEGIHSLRETFFGPRVTDAFYGEEERLSRMVLKLMSLEADDNLSMPEKAHKALMLMQAHPELAGINDPKRN
jgi:hypothetical protein